MGVNTTAGLSIASGRAVLLIVDVQERLAAAMPGKVQAQLERNAGVLLEAARRLDIPVVVSQQYPKGLGSTVAALEKSLAGMTPHRFDKVEFNACAAAGFGVAQRALGTQRDQWIVIGMETHVCVYQTVRELTIRGYSVHVPQDAVASRTKANWQVGLRLIEHTGAVVTATEVVVFDALGRAGGEDFKALSRLIK